MIDRYKNKERDIEIRISLRSPVLPIFFLIYISKIFDKLAKSNQKIASLSSVDNPGFIAFRSLVKNIIKTIKKVPKRILKLGKNDIVIYNIARIKVVLFFTLHYE